jgi:hypothetical protein
VWTSLSHSDDLPLLTFAYLECCFHVAALLKLSTAKIGLFLHSFNYHFFSLLGSLHYLPVYRVDPGVFDLELDYDFENNGWDE